MSEKSNGDSNFHMETDVCDPEAHSFQDKVRNFKLAAINTIKELLESFRSCRVNT